MDAHLKLTITNGPQNGQVIELKADKITVGRGETNDVVLNDMTISKHHALLSVEGSVLVVRDLASTNGTFVNGKKVTAPTPLKPGDELQVGANIRLQLSGAAVQDRTIVAAAPVRPPAQKSRGGLWAVVGVLVVIGLLVGAFLVWQGLRPPEPTTPQALAPEIPPATPFPSASGTPAPTQTAAPAAETRIEFSAEPLTVRFGDCATVSWAVDNSSDVRLDGEMVPAAGNRPICPQKSEETHILTALTADGTIKEASITLTVQATPTPQPGVKVTFFAEQGTLAYQDCTTLRWQVENAQSVTLNRQSVDNMGSQQICPREAFNTYRLLARSAGGGVSEQTVIVYVQATPTPAPAAPTPTVTPATLPAAPTVAPPAINQFIADQYSLQSGDCTLLHWSVSGAKQASIDGTPVANQGSKQVCSAGTYVLSAVGSSGQSASATVQVRVIAQATSTPAPAANNAPYTLQLGGQHRYEEPWGGDFGDPCEAYRTGKFDDDHPFYRGFNMELLLGNNAASKIER